MPSHTPRERAKRKASPRAALKGANRSVRATPRSRVPAKARARTTRIPR